MATTLGVIGKQLSGLHAHVGRNPMLRITGNGRETHVKQFSFPDSQPHVAVEYKSSRPRITASIRSPKELIDVLLAHAALMNSGAQQIDLNILYLMGARMDEALPLSNENVEPEFIIPDIREFYHPFTLNVISNVLTQTCDWGDITIFDPHSAVSTALLRARAIWPTYQIASAIEATAKTAGIAKCDVLLVAPDAGADKRLSRMDPILRQQYDLTMRVTQCIKHRDLATGKLNGFKLCEPGLYKDRDCLIIDDLIDGGWTFSSLATLMREANAKSISLYVSHGIFSKGFDLDYIDHIYTTDSYWHKGVPSYTVDPPSKLTVFNL